MFSYGDLEVQLYRARESASAVVKQYEQCEGQLHTLSSLVEEGYGILGPCHQNQQWKAALCQQFHGMALVREKMTKSENRSNPNESTKRE
jgi:hypothetical protein